MSDMIEPGVAGRVAVLTGEVRSLRVDIVRLAAVLAEIRGALSDHDKLLAALIERQDRTLAMIAGVAEGVVMVHELLTAPIEPELVEPPAGDGEAESVSDDAVEVVPVQATDDAASK